MVVVFASVVAVFKVVISHREVDIVEVKTTSDNNRRPEENRPSGEFVEGKPETRCHTNKFI